MMRVRLEKKMNLNLSLVIFFILCGIAEGGVDTGNKVVYTVAPKETDKNIQHFLNENWIIYKQPAAVTANLFLFLPGTSVPIPTQESLFSGMQSFLGVAADAGYRVIALQYDNDPSIMQICSLNNDPSCSENFRVKRIFGDNVTPMIKDAPAESIVNRLTKLLQFLDKHYPKEGWGSYLTNGVLIWKRIAVAGFSQGAGMAAFIAKRQEVARVVLFSGPEDYINSRSEIQDELTPKDKKGNPLYLNDWVYLLGRSP